LEIACRRSTLASLEEGQLVRTCWHEQCGGVITACLLYTVAMP
jgi:hypothetical protein